jgi:hypothetical protein
MKKSVIYLVVMNDGNCAMSVDMGFTNTPFPSIKLVQLIKRYLVNRES